MKKILGFSLILCMLVAVLAINAYAAPTLLWEFGTGTGIEDTMGVNSAANAVTYAAEDFYHIFTTSGGDPNVSIDLSVDDVSKVAWVKARVLNKSTATAIEFFGATDGRGLSGPECTHIDILPGSDVWQTVIVNVAESNVATANAYKNPAAPLTETYWAGTVDWIRLDPMWKLGEDGLDAGGSMAADEQIYIDYIAFFSTEADAIAYVGAAEQAAVVETTAAETTVAETAAAETTSAETAVTDTSDSSTAVKDNTIIYIIIAVAAVAVIIVIVAVVVKSNKKVTKK